MINFITTHSFLVRFYFSRLFQRRIQNAVEHSFQPLTIFAKKLHRRSLLNYVPTSLNYYVPTSPHFSRAYVLTYLYISFVTTCFRALNYYVPACAHFSCTYVSTMTQDLGTDKYPADVKSDENQYFNTSDVVKQDLLVQVLRIQNTRKSIVLDNFLICLQIIVSAHAPVETTKTYKVGLRYTVLEARVYFGVLNGIKGQIIQRKTAV